MTPTTTLAFYDLADDSSELLATLLTGHVISITQDEELIVLGQMDGRKIGLVCSQFGLLMDDCGSC